MDCRKFDLSITYDNDYIYDETKNTINIFKDENTEKKIIDSDLNGYDSVINKIIHCDCYKKLNPNSFGDIVFHNRFCEKLLVLKDNGNDIPKINSLHHQIILQI